MNAAHWVFTWLFNVTYGTKLRDPFTMYKVFRSECIEGVEFVADRFDFDWELAGKLVRLGYKPIEIPVEYNARWLPRRQEGSILPGPARPGSPRASGFASVLCPRSVVTHSTLRNETGVTSRSGRSPIQGSSGPAMRWTASRGRSIVTLRAERVSTVARLDASLASS